jgi:TorA maturation chaperone TorD
MSVEPEDLARADLYGVLARLFYAAPDAQFLSELKQRAAGVTGAAGQEGGLAAAWRALGEACASAFPSHLENEHTELFVSAGRAEITPYLSHYTLRSQADAPLVQLREQLKRWGLARRSDVFEPEDHISGLCEVMRFAIAVQHRSLDEQRNFFERTLYPGATHFLEALTKSEKARFYKRVAELARAFFEIEREAFSMV